MDDFTLKMWITCYFQLNNQNPADEMEETIQKLQELQEQQKLVAMEQQEAMAGLVRETADLKDNSGDKHY